MYVDGFVLPLQEPKLAEYTAMAELFARKARDVGAIASVEALGDGLEHGHTTDFFRAVKAEDGENVVFSFVLWPDKATRDAGWEKLMADPELSLQSILITAAIIGKLRAWTYVGLVALFSTVSGLTYGAWVNGMSLWMLVGVIGSFVALIIGTLNLIETRRKA